MRLLKWISAIALLAMSAQVMAMGLRTFVALPVEQGGVVLRFQGLSNLDTNVDNIIANVAYGISGTQTLLLGTPFRISPSGSNRTSDVSALYRHIVWQKDEPARTSRLGLLGGALIPTNSNSDGGVQGGAVATFYRGRHEWDIDSLLSQGFGNSPNTARYDISWQYRLTPAEYPEWGTTPEWDGVLELNGRWIQGNNLVHQATVGLQWIHLRWVLEGGVIQDINNPHDTRLLISTRIHF